MAMPSKLKPKWYFCETYLQNFYFFIGWSYEDFAEYLRTRYGFVTSNNGAKGRVITLEHPDQGERFFIWTAKSDDYPVLAHECLHAVNRTFRKRGIEVDTLNDEPQAYMLTALMRKALS